MSVVICIDLYYKYGIMPFLDYLKRLKGDGPSEEQLFGEYVKLDSCRKDNVHAESRF